MASTTSGSVKNVIETGGLGLAAYRDEAPADAALPYVVIHEGISVIDAGGFRGNDGDRWVSEEIDVRLFQSREGEAYGLIDRLVKRLADAATYPPIGDNGVHEVRVGLSSRIPPAPASTSVSTTIPVVVKRGI